jgi:hypothetical protein
MYNIPDEFCTVTKPIIEVRGLDGDGIRARLEKDLAACTLINVDNFNLLPQYISDKSAARAKDFQVPTCWLKKYSECRSPLWLDFFYLSPLEPAVDEQIVEDLGIGAKFSQVNARKYIPIIICPDQNAFSGRLLGIRNAVKSTYIFVLEGPNDNNCFQKYFSNFIINFLVSSNSSESPSLLTTKSLGKSTKNSSTPKLTGLSVPGPVNATTRSSSALLKRFRSTLPWPHGK